MLNGKTLQLVLNSLGHGLAVDGVVGSRTFAALNKSIPDHPWLKKLAEQLGIKERDFLSFTQIDQLASRVAQEEQIPASYLLSTFKIENKQVTGGIEVEYEGTFRGIGQFNAKTWNSVMDVPFSEVTNHTQSAIATARLYKANKVSFLNAFPSGKYTDEIAYLYHNQGASSATRYLRYGLLRYPKQSRHALNTFALARGQHHGNSSGFIA